MRSEHLIVCLTGLIAWPALHARADAPLHVVLRVASDDERALMPRLRGQLSDMDVRLSVVEAAQLEAALPDQLARAQALASEHDADVLVWCTAADKAPQYLLHILLRHSHGILSRQLTSSAHGPLNSSELETAALLVRSALIAVAQAPELGQPTPEAIAANSGETPAPNDSTHASTDAQPPSAARSETQPRTALGSDAPSRAAVSSEAQPRIVSGTGDAPLRAAARGETQPRISATGAAPSRAAVESEAQPRAAVGSEAQPRAAVGSEAQPRTAVGSEAQPRISATGAAPSRAAVESEAQPRTAAATDALLRVAAHDGAGARVAEQPPGSGAGRADTLAAGEVPAPEPNRRAKGKSTLGWAETAAVGGVDKVVPERPGEARAELAPLRARLALAAQFALDGQSSGGQRGFYASAGLGFGAWAVSAFGVVSLPAQLADEFFAVSVARHALGVAVERKLPLSDAWCFGLAAHAGALLLRRTSQAKSSAVLSYPPSLLAALAFGPELALSWLPGRFGVALRLGVDVLPMAPRFQSAGASPEQAHSLWAVQPRVVLGWEAALP